MSSKVNVTVSQDGQGNFRTITEAVKNAPFNSSKRYVIYIKVGFYMEEMVVVKQSNIMFLGDGMGKTVMRTTRSDVDGQNIQQSANLDSVIQGSDFIAQDMSFQNTAAIEKHQAVALKNDGDKSVFYRCSFEGHQDTLYVNQGRQFYRECEISGTIDFIFGDASAVFQKCTIKVRTPIKGEANVITAQGRENVNLNTAISIQDCLIINGEPCPGMPCLDPQVVKTYLGRPWMKYSRTMIMQSFIDFLVDPAGWLPHEGYEKTCTYREFQNRGPGADTSRRVRWLDYKAIDDPREAMTYTVNSLIQGDEWIPATGVPYVSGLI
ncbi:Pectinesterase 3 [Acorus gramineus]|uniref:Pectinesterase n=1 Tax=Acorus gramineus TaxID=55184 RepID=A0AAV9BVS4_ACOGR|nr:Pectinesterase 3 [Acorus gramineus]